MQVPEQLEFMVNSRKPQKHTTERMDGKRCVITGGTSGVGYQAALRLAEAGADLIIVCRNQEKGDAVRQEIINKYFTQADVVLADFLHLDQVKAAADKILEHYPHVDILINNAGIHATQRRLNEEGIETVFCVNHLAAFVMTKKLLPRLISSAPAKVLYVNSEGHRFNGLDLNDLDWAKRHYRGLKGYGAAKTAQLLTLWEFAEQLEGTPVTINAMHPGAVRTNIGLDNGIFYRAYNQYFLRWFLKDPAIAGDAIHYLLAAPEMAEVTGKFFNLTHEEKPAAHALDREVGKKVWRISHEMTGLAE